MPDSPHRYHRFGGFCLDTQARELRSVDGALVPLSAKAYDTLCCLVDNRDRVVSKDELLAAVWPGRVVEENNLTQAISALRRALGSDLRCIATVPGRGYRFVADLADGQAPSQAAPVAAVEAPPPAAVEAPSMPAPRPPDRRRAFPGLLALLALVAVLAWVLREPTSPAPAADATLAVLPFQSLSKTEDDELLAYGLAETLISRISGATSLRVKSFSSSRAFSAANQDPLDAARQLDAAYVVVGTTQRLGEQIRVTVRLLAVQDGGTLWSGTFDEHVDGLFTLQDGIAQAVTSALATTLRTQPALSRSPCEVANSEANRAYLQGRFLLERPTGERMRQAIASFQRALELDPACARAYARLGFAYRALSMTGDQDPAKMFPLAQAAVARALEIDPLLAEAHSSLGFIRFWHDWDWRGSEASFRRAMELNPSLAEAHSGYAHLLSNLGRNDEAVIQAQQAIALDPLSPIVNTLASSFFAGAGRTEEAQALNRKARELDPDFWVAILTTRAPLATPDDHAARLAELRRALELCGSCSQVLAVLGQTYASAGDREAAADILEQMQQRRRVGYVPATSIATVSNALGDTEATLALLEQAFDERDIRMTFLRIDTRWDNLRGQPRFQALERRMAFDGAAADLAQKE